MPSREPGERAFQPAFEPRHDHADAQQHQDQDAGPADDVLRQRQRA